MPVGFGVTTKPDFITICWQYVTSSPLGQASISTADLRQSPAGWSLAFRSICSAVVFAILLVSANTMAMSIRERTREVAVLKTLGFTRQTLLGLFVGEAVTLSLVGGILGSLAAYGLIVAYTHSPQANGFFTVLPVSPGTIAVAMIVASVVGFLSALVPSYHASKLDIVEGLRHIG